MRFHAMFTDTTCAVVNPTIVDNLAYGLLPDGESVHNITKTCLYNFDPLKSHFYIVKLGFTGVYIIFLLSAQNIDCGYLLKSPRRGGFTGTQK